MQSLSEFEGQGLPVAVRAIVICEMDRFAGETAKLLVRGRGMHVNVVRHQALHARLLQGEEIFFAGDDEHLGHLGCS